MVGTLPRFLFPLFVPPSGNCLLRVGAPALCDTLNGPVVPASSRSQPGRHHPPAGQPCWLGRKARRLSSEARPAPSGSQPQPLVRGTALAVRSPWEWGQMAGPASSVRRDPADGCLFFHRPQLSYFSPRSVTQAGEGASDGEERLLFRPRAPPQAEGSSPGGVIGFTPSEPTCGQKSLSLGLGAVSKEGPVKRNPGEDK